jgi:hypothetical protein
MRWELKLGEVEWGCTYLLDNNWANMTGQSYWWVRHWFVISHHHTIPEIEYKYVQISTHYTQTCILCIQLQEDHLRSWETIYIYILVFTHSLNLPSHLLLTSDFCNLLVHTSTFFFEVELNETSKATQLSILCSQMNCYWFQHDGGI